MSNVLITQQKLIGGIVATPGINTNLWYTRESFETFSINGAFNGLETPFDWVLLKDIDSKYIKAGKINITNSKKSELIKFKTLFVDTNYQIFFLSNKNINLYWDSKRKDSFTINSSYDLQGEICWLAVHTKANTLYGSNGIVTGTRPLSYDNANWNGTAFTSGSPIFNSDGLSMPVINPDGTVDDNTSNNPDYTIPPYACVNLNGWFKNEYIIKPSIQKDGIPTQELSKFDYRVKTGTNWSMLISSNININSFWIEKGLDRIKIGTSYPKVCIIDYLIIQAGLNWWDII